MNRIIRGLGVLSCLILGAPFLSAAAVDPKMDPLAVAPNMYKLVYQNERVRVMEVTFKPGEKIAAHAHPDHYVYVLEAGKLSITKDKKTSDVDLQVGQVIWIPAETHSAKNSGTSQIRLLVHELK